MINFINIELLKTLKYKPFVIILFLHLLFFQLGIFAIPRIDIDFPFLSIIPLYQFPHVWNFITWIGGIYNITLVLLIIMMTCLEFNARTYKQQVIFGLSRRELFLQKITLAILLSLYVALMFFITSIISGLIFSYKLTFSIVFERSWIIANTFLQTFAYMMMGILFALLLKNMILSVLVFGFYRVFFEPIIRNVIKNEEASWFFPTKFTSHLTPMPDIFDLVKQKMQNSEAASTQELENYSEVLFKGVPMLQNVLLTIVFLGFTLWMSYYIFQKRQLN